MSNRVHGIRILVGAGLALPNQASDPEKGAASSAPTIQMPQRQTILLPTPFPEEPEIIARTRLSMTCVIGPQRYEALGCRC